MSFIERFSERPAPDHAAGTFDNQVLARIEQLLPASMEKTVETGCGKSTILFSNISQAHHVYCVDDREDSQSSVRYFQTHPLTRLERVSCVFGPSQLTLPRSPPSGPLDCVLLDGPHGYPFPELEYYWLYPHLKTGGFLIVDDVHIPTIGRMADVIQEDEMFDLVEVVSTTAVFRRTPAATLSPTGDGWWTQKFNRRRIPATWEFHCADASTGEPFAARFAASPATTAPATTAVQAPEVVRSFRRRLRRAARMVLLGR
jgi:predicted O-methyltransferase YrrM